MSALDPRLQAAIDEYPADTCYKQVGGRHYVITEYSLMDDGSVTVQIVHGSDSTLPGVSAFGCSPGELERCDCGLWEPPTDEQILETTQKIAAIGELRKLGVNDVN